MVQYPLRVYANKPGGCPLRDGFFLWVQIDSFVFLDRPGDPSWLISHGTPLAFILGESVRSVFIRAAAKVARAASAQIAGDHPKRTSASIKALSFDRARRRARRGLDDCAGRVFGLGSRLCLCLVSHFADQPITHRAGRHCGLFFRAWRPVPEPGFGDLG